MDDFDGGPQFDDSRAAEHNDHDGRNEHDDGPQPDDELSATFTDIGIEETRRAVEAILLVSTDPVPAQVLAQVLEVQVEHVELLCHALAESYEAANHGFQLVEVAGGWRYQTHPDMAPYVERYAVEGMSAKLSNAALETLAIVAYKQPISRAQVSAIRGVNVDAVLRTLVQRGYVDEIGRDTGAGQAVLFGTTSQFLERLGVNSLQDLPALGDFVPSADVVEALEQTLKVNLAPDPDLVPVDDAEVKAEAGASPVDDAPVDDAPVDDAPVDDAPVDEMPVDGFAEQVTPADEESVAESAEAQPVIDVDPASTVATGEVEPPGSGDGGPEGDDGAEGGSPSAEHAGQGAGDDVASASAPATGEVVGGALVPPKSVTDPASLGRGGPTDDLVHPDRPQPAGGNDVGSGGTGTGWTGRPPADDAVLHPGDRGPSGRHGGPVEAVDRHGAAGIEPGHLGLVSAQAGVDPLAGAVVGSNAESLDADADADGPGTDEIDLRPTAQPARAGSDGPIEASATGAPGVALGVDRPGPTAAGRPATFPGSDPGPVIPSWPFTPELVESGGLQAGLVAPAEPLPGPHDRIETDDIDTEADGVGLDQIDTDGVEIGGREADSHGLVRSADDDVAQPSSGPMIDLRPAEPADADQG